MPCICFAFVAFLFSTCFLVVFLVVLLDYRFSYNYMRNSTSSTNNKSRNYKRSSENNKRNKRNKNNQNNKNSKRKKNNYNGKRGSCLCVPWGGGTPPSPHAPLQLFLFCCCVLSFLPVWVSLRWSKNHGVNELVNKLRFHNASIKRKSPCKMDLSCCKYHLQNPANTMQHERIYLPHGKYPHKFSCLFFLLVWRLAL